MTIELFDFSIEIPEGLTITQPQSSAGVVTHTFIGSQVRDFAARVESLGREHGFQVAGDERCRVLQRGESRMEIFVLEPERLVLRVDDVESLPRSKVRGLVLQLGPIEMGLSPGTTIEPGRERHVHGSTTWEGDWRLHGSSAPVVAAQIHDAVVSQGFRGGGVWSPPIGGIARWKVEASSPVDLIQANVLDCGEYLDLRVLLVLGSRRVNGGRL